MAQKGLKDVIFNIKANADQAEQEINALGYKLDYIKKDGNIQCSLKIKNANDLNRLNELSGKDGVKIKVDTRDVKTLQGLINSFNEQGLTGLGKSMQKQLKAVNMTNLGKARTNLNKQIKSLQSQEADTYIDLIRNSLEHGLKTDNSYQRASAAAYVDRLKKMGVSGSKKIDFFDGTAATIDQLSESFKRITSKEFPRDALSNIRNISDMVNSFVSDLTKLSNNVGKLQPVDVEKIASGASLKQSEVADYLDEAKLNSRLQKLQEKETKKQADAKAKAEQKAKELAEKESQSKATKKSTQESTKKVEKEAKAKAEAEEQAKLKAEQEANKKSEAETQSRLKTEAEAKAKAEQEAKKKIEQQNITKAKTEEIRPIRQDDTVKTVSKESQKVKVDIDTTDLKSQISSITDANIKINFQVDDEINRIKSQLEGLTNQNIKINFLVDDEINKVKSQLEGLNNQNVKINIDVQPSVESIKSDLSALDKKKIDVKVNLGKSLENIQKLSNAFSSGDVQNYMHKMTELSSGFRTAFANLRDATKAPSTILDDLNKKAKTLKNTLNSVGVTKFKDMDKIQKQIDKATKAQKKEVDKAGDQMLNELAKMENDLAKKQAKTTSNSKNKGVKVSDGLLGDVDKAIKDADRLKSSLTDIMDVQNRYASAVKNLGDLRSSIADGSITADQLKTVNESLKTINELDIGDNRISNKSGILTQNDFSRQFVEDINSIDEKEIRNALQRYYKTLGKEATKIRKSGTDNSAWNISYVQDGMNMKDTVKFQQYFTGSVDGINQYSTALRTATKAESEYMTSGQKWMTGFKNKMSNLTQYMTGADILYRAAQELREGFTFVKDLNSLMTTIDQTSDITGQGLQELSQGAIDQAKSLGVAAEQVTGSIEVYAAYGETVDSLLGKAEPTTMLAKASGSDVKTASDQIQGVC